MFNKIFGSPLTDEEAKAQRARLEAELIRAGKSIDEKRKRVIEEMGAKWVYHPANQVYRRTKFTQSQGE